MDTSDISSLIIEDFEAFKKIVEVDGEQAIKEYLEYKASIEKVKTIIQSLC